MTTCREVALGSEDLDISTTVDAFDGYCTDREHDNIHCSNIEQSASAEILEETHTNTRNLLADEDAKTSEVVLLSEPNDVLEAWTNRLVMENARLIPI